MMRYFGWLLGFENARSIDAIEVTLAAPWADGQGWIVLGSCVLAAGLAVVYYRRFERCKTRMLRVALTALRATLLCLLLLTLAAPLVHSSATVLRSPLVVLILDNSESMRLADEKSPANTPITRLEQLRRQLGTGESGQHGADLIRRIEEQAACRVATFRLDDGSATSLAQIDRSAIATELTGAGPSSPLVAALAALPKQTRGQRVAAVVAFSDFADTSDAAVRAELAAAVSAVGSPIHTVGLGATQRVDIAIELRSEFKVKRGQPAKVTIELRQSGLDQARATVSLESRGLEYETSDRTDESQAIGQRTVVLDAADKSLQFSFTPEASGYVELVARVAPLDGEVLLDNNVATRQIGVIEDYLRVTYVEYEPNWEWRFIKEVFQRDELVGPDGFRTYLASSAASVRAENDLFNNELVPPRSEFFATDVIFIGDGPGELFTPEYCSLAEEFVERLGGGLVVVSGPRFGPGELAGTPLESMLPILLDGDARLRDANEFTLERTGEAALYPFMRLADSDAEDAVAWNNLGRLPWYQPVAGVHEQAQVLAAHPTDLCTDGQTKQPLIAIRPYGRGQVVYVGINELWRLRKRYGERYYQRFWSQLIYRLGMSHAVGVEKRFVADFERPAYRVGEEAVFSVEAFDEDYQPLGLSQLTAGSLVGELAVPPGEGEAIREISIPVTRPGHLEASVPLPRPGPYTIRIRDPISGRIYERRCWASDQSLERREIARNVELQQRIATVTGGQAYDISEVDRMVDQLRPEPTLAQEQRQIALWNTPLWFMLVVGLMLSEWTIRKLAFLR